jgi:hypothetical protein
MLINHNTFVLPFLIWAIYFFIKGLTSGLIKNFIISGFLTGVSVLFLQHKGIILLFSLSLFLFILWLKKKKHLWLKINLYFISCSLLPILLLFLKWPPKLLYENLIFPLYSYRAVNPTPYTLLIIFIFFLSYIVWFLRKEKNIIIWLLIFVQFFLLITVLQRVDIYHIIYIIFPIFCLLPFLYTNIDKKNKTKALFHYTAILVILIFSLITSLLHAIYTIPFYSIKDSDLIVFIQQNCHDKYIYAGPFLPSIYFESKKLNPTPYFVLLTNHQTEEQFLKAKKSLEKNKPDCAIMDYKMVKKFNHNQNNPVDNYIKDNYKLIKQINNKLIYKKQL